MALIFQGNDFQTEGRTGDVDVGALIVVHFLLELCAGIGSKACVFDVRGSLMHAEGPEGRANVNVLVFAGLTVFAGGDAAAAQRAEDHAGPQQSENGRSAAHDCLQAPTSDSSTVPA